MKQEELVKGLKILGTAYGTSFTKEECELWYEFLGEYDYDIFKKAVKNIIKTKKYIPKISELVEECEEQKTNLKIEIIEYMNSRGYFKSPSEKDKAKMFVNKNIIPTWLLQDMKKYYKDFVSVNRIDNKVTLSLGDGKV